MGWIHRMPGNFVCMVQPQPTAPAAPCAPSDKQKKAASTARKVRWMPLLYCNIKMGKYERGCVIVF